MRSIHGLCVSPRDVRNSVISVLSKSTIAAQCTVFRRFESTAQEWRPFRELCSVTTSVTSPGATLSVCTPPSVSDAPVHSRTDTHSPYFKTSQTAPSSTCLLSYLPPSLPGSQIPTVSAHVNSEITGHAHTHVCFAFKRVISLCTQAVLRVFFFCACVVGQCQKTKRAGFKAKKTRTEVHEEMCRDDGRDIGGASLCNDKGGGRVVFGPVSLASAGPASVITNLSPNKSQLSSAAWPELPSDQLRQESPSRCLRPV